MTNSPSLGGSMNTHNTISFTSCQTKIYYLLFISKNNKQMYPIFCTLFANFHTLTMVPGKALFTLPVALPRTNPVGQEPIRWAPAWVCPRGPAKSFPKLNNSPLLRGKEKYRNCTILPGFPGVSRGVDPRGSK